ncbi:NAD(P)-binding protein [Kocuria cellulosilytica]|uniref:NAD(P)-binding protein n=1 Tax=Kocuria cellulosilytica TaxID=3071451 RepID=UPI0034D7774E
MPGGRPLRHPPDATRTAGFLAWCCPSRSTEVPVMNAQHIETLIIGAGQAGLATGSSLKQLGRPFLIVDAEARVGGPMAAPVGQPPALHPGQVRRAARPALPAGPLVLSGQGRCRRLPRELRPPPGPARAHEHHRRRRAGPPGRWLRGGPGRTHGSTGPRCCG